MTLTRLHISVLLGVVVALWWIVLALQGVSASKEHLLPFGVVVSALAIIGTVFELWVWRWSALHGWFVKRPNLAGTWLVELQSNWVGEDGQPQPQKTCYMGIVQTLSKLQMHLMTDESESWLVADSVVPAQSGEGYQVVGVYTNTPKIDLRHDRSNMHFGALVLTTHGPKARPDSLTGEYWTDRQTSGRLHFVRRVEEIHTRFEDAASALGQV